MADAPVSSGDPLQPDEPERPGEVRGPVSVVLADDQALMRMGFRMVLEAEEDITVVGEASDGTSALAQAKALHPDVILMDVRMPVLNGIDATARITQLYPSIRTLVLTTYDQDEFAFGALSAGASGFLLKDTRTAQLHQALRAVSSGDAILTPRITRELLNRHILSPIASPQQRTARRRLGRLSPREREVAELVAEGLTNAEIAQQLVLAPDSVKKNVTRILTKLDLRDRVQLVILMRDAQS